MIGIGGDNGHALKSTINGPTPFGINSTIFWVQIISNIFEPPTRKEQCFYNSQFRRFTNWRKNNTRIPWRNYTYQRQRSTCHQHSNSWLRNKVGKKSNKPNRKQRITVQISENNLEKDFVNFVTKFIASNLQYHLFFENPRCFRMFFCNITGNISLVKYVSKNVLQKEDTENVIKNTQGKSNHRVMSETLLKLKNTIIGRLWKKQFKQSSINVKFVSKGN